MWQDSSILKPFSKNKPCYYCGAPPPSTREHAPVKSMFDAFDCDRITVPACDKHNTKKNLDDRAIVTFFIRGLYSGLKNGTLTGNVMRAFEAAEPWLGEAREVTLRPFMTDPLAQNDTPLPYIDEIGKVRAWMRQLTAALVWSVIGEFDSSIEWRNVAIWSPELVPDIGLLGPEQAALRLKRLQAIKADIDRLSLHWWSGWSSFPESYPPDIYRFEISFLPSQYLLQDSGEQEIIFRHWFYAQFSWYAWFTASQQVKQGIMDVIRKVHRV